MHRMANLQTKVMHVILLWSKHSLLCMRMCVCVCIIAHMWCIMYHQLAHKVVAQHEEKWSWILPEPRPVPEVPRHATLPQHTNKHRTLPSIAELGTNYVRHPVANQCS